MIAQMSYPWWSFVLLGICAGVLSGTLGLGSGIILVPALVLLGEFEQKSAQGMALAVMVPMTLVGALRYWKDPEIEINIVLVGLIVCGALAGALAGTELASRLPSHILRKLFAAVLVIVALRMFTTSAKPGRPGLDNIIMEQKTTSSPEYGETNNEPEIQ